MTTPKAPEVIQSDSFICDCEVWMRTACKGEEFYKEYEGNRFCVLHYPGNEKAEDFKVVLERKLDSKDFDFCGIWFPYRANFAKARFSVNADFSKAIFSMGATFSADADFALAKFSEDANFSNANFSAKAHFNDTDFKKAADFREAIFSENVRFIAANFKAAADFSDASFSKEVYFSDASFTAAAKFAIASFNADANFSKATFGADADFSKAIFSADANFNSASFSAGPNFSKANFSAAAKFGFASFSADADFSDVSFSAGADFSSAAFSAAANFSSASFGAAAKFNHTSFSDAANFIETTFKDYFYFTGSSSRRSFGDQQRLNFQFAHFEKPDRVSFRTLDLKPHWFVHVDSRKFEFIDVEFRFVLNEELKYLNNANVIAPHRLLAIACRQLAANAEENHRYKQAADFRYASMDAERLEWLQDPKKRKFQFLHWLYWIASGYGERVGLAFGVLAVLWLLFAFSYTKVGFEHKTNNPSNDQQSIAPQEDVAPKPVTITTQTLVISETILSPLQFEHKTDKPSGNQSAIVAQQDVAGKPLPFNKVFTYSLGVMSLQKPDPKPVTTVAQTLVIFETILCPLQAALLALAIRRRFMR